MNRSPPLLHQLRVVTEGLIPFLLYAPKASSTQLRPLVVFLHGAGEKGTDTRALLRAPLPSLLESGHEIDAFVLVPQCHPDASGWDKRHVKALIDHVAIDHPIDPRRIVMTGVSMGARGCWEYAYDLAGTLSALAPLCGFGIPTLAHRLGALPTWIFHGDQDVVVPVQRALDMALALEAAGGDVRSSILPDVGHEIGANVYARPEFWAWALRERPRVP